MRLWHIVHLVSWSTFTLASLLRRIRPGFVGSSRAGSARMVSISPRGGAGSGYAHSGEWQEVDTPTQDRGRKWIHQLKGKGRKWARPCKEGQEVDTPTQERGKKWIHPLRRGAGSGYTHSGEG